MTAAGELSVIGAITGFGGTVDMFFFVLTAISAAMLAVLALGILYFLIRYRKGSKADRAPPRFSGQRLEIAWIAATTVAFVAIGFWGAFGYLQMAKPPPGEPLEVYAIGRQWMWEILHPSGRREHNRLHVPRDQPVRVNMISEDVIHSFYIPAFRLKHDVMPGKFTSLWFDAKATGEYHLFCAEFCGTDHHQMLGQVIVMEASAYAEWSRGGSEPNGLAEQGKQLFSSRGCAGCHSPGSSVRAPALEGLYGSMVALQDGRFVKADEAYLHDSILLPNKAVARGYEPIMPTYQDIMDTDEAIALVEHIKSLGDADRAPERTQP